MRLVAELLRLSATDLANHLGCAHLSQLDLAVAEGRAKRPHRNDPDRRAADRARPRARGRVPEAPARAEAHRRRDPHCAGRDNVEATLAAMRDGADVIYQAPLADERWYGRADFLRKVAAPSALGDWSYEVTDAKLATETRAGTILQLCVYSTLLEQLQGRKPEAAHVVAPHHHFVPESYRLADYDAYYRLVKKRLETALAARDAITYPEPAQHCDVCNWWSQCNARRRADDHLTFVAGISRLQIKELRTRLERRHARAARRSEGYREAEARLSRGARAHPRPSRDPAESTPHARATARGLAARARARLLTPAGTGARRSCSSISRAIGSRSTAAASICSASATRATATRRSGRRTRPRKSARSRTWSTASSRRSERTPAMHVYHFGAYEPTSFKRLSGRYATRENELDTILRAELFVDLHTIVRHSLRASVETYSLKDLEQFYGLVREQDLRIATASRRALEWAIEMREDLGLQRSDRCEAGCGQAAARARPRCRARREQVRRAPRRRRALQPRRLRVRGAVARLAREAARRGRAR